MKKEADSQDPFSFQSCRSSAVDHVEEMSLESPRKSPDVQVLMCEEDAWRWNQKDKRRRWKAKLFRTEWKAPTWILMVKVAMRVSK